MNAKYPARIPPYLSKHVGKSKAIARQFLPDERELTGNGSLYQPCKGKLKTRVESFEQLYRERVLLRINKVCEANCRFCFAKNYSLKQEKVISETEFKKALQIILKNSEIRGITISGGSPLILGLTKIESFLKPLAEIEHVNQIYLALGRPIMNPFRFTDELAELLKKYNKPDFKNPEKSKKVAASVHINHPDELTPEVLNGLFKLTSKEIHVYNQTTLLKGVNDDKEVLEKLYMLCTANNILPYYLIHAMPVKGAMHFRTSVKKGVEIIRHLEKFSGHERPIFIVVTEVGKVAINGRTKIKEKIIDGRRYVEIETPYKTEEFLKHEKLSKLPHMCYDRRGYIVEDYLDGED